MSQGRADAGGSAVLLCRADGRLCLFPLDSILETMRPLPIRSLPSSPPHVLGVSLVRGRPSPVVHLGLLLGSADPTAPGRFVTVRTADGAIAIAVDAVVGIRALPGEALGALPSLVDGIPSGVVAAIGASDAELLFTLHSARFVDRAVWDAVEASA